MEFGNGMVCTRDILPQMGGIQVSLITARVTARTACISQLTPFGTIINVKNK